MRLARLPLLVLALALLPSCGVSNKLERRAQGVIQEHQETATECEPAGATSTSDIST
jgi:uncharacterized lipoprotein